MFEYMRNVRTRQRDRKRGSSTRKKRRSAWNKGVKNPVLSASTSAKKLSASEYPTSNFSGYRIFDIDILKKIFNDVTCCKLCGGDIIFEEFLTCGIGGDYSVKCQDCNFIQSFSNCAKIGKRKTSYELNRRAVLAARLIGNGLRGLSLFCGIMDLPPPVNPNAFSKIQITALQASREEANASMHKAVKEEIDMSEPNLITGAVPKIIVKGDGTWQKRGFKSLNGAVSIIGSETEKVIDTEVLSSYCRACVDWTLKNGPPSGQKWDEWYGVHKLVCKRNYIGSAGGMESAGVIRIFKRSLEKYNVFYTHYIGDGDTKTFFNLMKAQPYGPEVAIEKLECIGHIGKRFGHQLRKLKENFKGRKLSDGKGLSGKGRLTEKLIVSIQTYYTGAVRNNPTSLSGMIRDIWAIWYHMSSTDDSPQHQLCPVGRSSWCKYQRAASSSSIQKFHHKNIIPKVVMDAIRPVFVHMTSVSLLKRCLGGRTQNSNESFNSILWKVCPKSTFVGLDTLALGSQIATVLFNDGMAGILRIMQRLNIQPGINAISAAKIKDTIRRRKSEVKNNEDMKKRRQIYRRLKINLQEYCEDQNEEPEYAAGAY